MHMKTLLTVTALSLLSTDVMAKPKDFSGPYVGANIGGSYGTVGASAFSAGGGTAFSGSSTNNGGGVDGGAMVGYLHKMGKKYPVHLGVEIGTSVASTRGKENTSGTDTPPSATMKSKHKFTRPHAFQASVVAGYPVSNTIMPFAKIGWENALWKHKVTGTTDMNGGTTGTAKSSKRQNGLHMGGGVLKKVSKQAQVGLEYAGTVHFDNQTSTGGGVKAKHKNAQNHKFMTVVHWVFKK